MPKVYTIDSYTVTYGGYALRELGNGSLTISKTVSGSGFDPAKTFEIVVTFSVPVTYNGTTSTTHTFNLAHGQSVTITGIPELTTYEVTETPLSPQDSAEGYIFDRISNSSGTILESTIEATAYNIKGLPAKTAQFRFSNTSYDPSQNFRAISGEPPFTWTRVSSNPNVWNYYKDSTDWSSSFAAPSNVNYHFNGQSTGNITLLDANLYGVIELEDLFVNCYNLIKVENLRNTNSVTNAAYMFAACYNLTSVPLFDTSNVTTMVHMFGNSPQTSRGPSFSTIPLYDTSKVTDMSGMFGNCYNLITIPLLDTSNVTNMAAMFSDCRKMTSIPNLDTSKVTSMRWTFSGCYSLLYAPTIDTSNVTDMEGMFCMPDIIGSSDDIPVLKQVPNYNVSSVTNVISMFERCLNVESGTFSLYQRLVQSNPSHTNCFKNCGANTTSGAAELAQIPSGWK